MEKREKKPVYNCSVIFLIRNDRFKKKIILIATISHLYFTPCFQCSFSALYYCPVMPFACCAYLLLLRKKFKECRPICIACNRLYASLLYPKKKKVDQKIVILSCNMLQVYGLFLYMQRLQWFPFYMQSMTKSFQV